MDSVKADFTLTRYRKERLVTSTYKLTVSFAILINFLCLSAYAQSGQPELNHFSVDGISFDYLAEYSVADESTNDAQRLILTRKGTSVQLTIVVLRRVILSNELQAAFEQSTKPLINEVAAKLTTDKTPPKRTSTKIQVGPWEAEGLLLQSNTGKSISEIVWLRLGFRLTSMAFVTSDADESGGAELWKTVRSSIKVDAPVVGARKAETEPSENANTPKVLNEVALSLPKPAYPPIARAAGVSGTVIVQVIIDEQGNVIDARAVSGHPLLFAVSVAAARQAKFKPTLLEGEPVRVTGVIQYTFIAR